MPTANIIATTIRQNFRIAFPGEAIANIPNEYGHL
jgi:hypothetical protein